MRMMSEGRRGEGTVCRDEGGWIDVLLLVDDRIFSSANRIEG